MTEQNSIVALDRFIQATRDSGYRGTSSAVAELVDNSFQAGAERVSIRVTPRGEREVGLTLTVRDDGQGMSPTTLREALRFGGTTRFGSRSGLGRFGMGLPNASLNQARRVEVFSWQDSGKIWMSYLDVDEIATDALVEVPEPTEVEPSGVPGGPPDSKSGTVVYWTRADRLDNRRPTTIHRKLMVTMGRVFRYFLWSGATLTVGDERVVPIDPLFVRDDSLTTGGVLEDEWTCEVLDSPAGVESGTVTVRFASLPVASWSRWSQEEKRSRGITNGAGVSIVREGREVDYGWYFMGGKRRQNYDDWWRAEVSFSPLLDTAFGISHTKQSIRPAAHLTEALTPYIEGMARELHKQVRSAYSVTNGRPSQNSESLRVGLAMGTPDASRPFLVPVSGEKPTHAELNPVHPFFCGGNGQLQSMLHDGHPVSALLLAAAKAEIAASASDRGALRRFRDRWSQTLASLLNGERL